MAIFDDPLVIIILMIVVVAAVALIAVAMRKKKAPVKETPQYSPYGAYARDEYGQYPSYGRAVNPQMQGIHEQFGYPQYGQGYQYGAGPMHQAQQSPYGNYGMASQNYGNPQYGMQGAPNMMNPNNYNPNSQFGLQSGQYGNYTEQYGQQAMVQVPQGTYLGANQNPSMGMQSARAHGSQPSQYPQYPQYTPYSSENQGYGQPATGEFPLYEQSQRSMHQANYQQGYPGPQVEANAQPEEGMAVRTPIEQQANAQPQALDLPQVDKPSINEVDVSKPTVIAPPRKKPKIVTPRGKSEQAQASNKCPNCGNDLPSSGSCEYCDSSSAVAKASTAIESARGMGIDVSQVEVTFQQAKDTLAAKSYEKVKQLSAEIIGAIELLKEEYKKTQAQLAQTQAIVAQYEQAGVDVTHGKRLLQMAEAFLMSGKYDKATQYAQKAEKMGKEAELRKKIDASRPKIAPPRIIAQTKCMACGAPLDPTVNTCNRCGTPVQTQEMVEQLSPSPQIELQPQVAQHQQAQYATQGQEQQAQLPIESPVTPQAQTQAPQPAGVSPESQAAAPKGDEPKITVIDNASGFQVEQENKPEAVKAEGEAELVGPKDDPKQKEVRLTAKKKEQTAEQRRDEYMKRATEQIEASEEAVAEIEKLGIDVMHAKNLLQLAKSFMRGKNFEKAYQYAVKSEHVARDLERRAKAGA